MKKPIMFKLFGEAVTDSKDETEKRCAKNMHNAFLVSLKENSLSFLQP